jgi:hypothetical protein
MRSVLFAPVVYGQNESRSTIGTAPNQSARDPAGAALLLWLPKNIPLYAEADAAPLTNASRSALIWSVLVVGMPCGKPG